MSDADWAAYTRHIIQAAITGLDNAAPSFTAAAEVKARANFPGQTTATFAGIYAAVDGAGVDSSGIVAAAIAAVEELNPEHSYTEDLPSPPDGVIRLIGSVPTDYIDKLEADPKRAFLVRTLDEEGSLIKASMDQAIGAVT